MRVRGGESVGDVLADGEPEEHWLLGHEGDAAAEEAGVQRGEVVPVQQHPPGVRSLVHWFARQETQQAPQRGELARAEQETGYVTTKLRNERTNQ